MTIAISDKGSIPKGTYGVNLHFVVYDNDGTVHDLTDLTVTFKVWKQGQTAIVSGTCTIDVAASGTCHYTIADGDFDTVGQYLWELELTKADYRNNTEPGPFKVTESG